MTSVDLIMTLTSIPAVAFIVSTDSEVITAVTTFPPPMST